MGSQIKKVLKLIENIFIIIGSSCIYKWCNFRVHLEQLRVWHVVNLNLSQIIGTKVKVNSLMNPASRKIVIVVEHSCRESQGLFYVIISLRGSSSDSYRFSLLLLFFCRLYFRAMSFLHMQLLHEFVRKKKKSLLDVRSGVLLFPINGKEGNASLPCQKTRW